MSRKLKSIPTMMTYEENDQMRDLYMEMFNDNFQYLYPSIGYAQQVKFYTTNDLVTLEMNILQNAKAYSSSPPEQKENIKQMMVRDFLAMQEVSNALALDPTNLPIASQSLQIFQKEVGEATTDPAVIELVQQNLKPINDRLQFYAQPTTASTGTATAPEAPAPAPTEPPTTASIPLPETADISGGGLTAKMIRLIYPERSENPVAFEDDRIKKMIDEAYGLDLYISKNIHSPLQLDKSHRGILLDLGVDISYQNSTVEQRGLAEWLKLRGLDKWREQFIYEERTMQREQSTAHRDDLGIDFGDAPTGDEPTHDTASLYSLLPGVQLYHDLVEKQKKAKTRVGVEKVLSAFFRNPPKETTEWEQIFYKRITEMGGIEPSRLEKLREILATMEPKKFFVQYGGEQMDIRDNEQFGNLTVPAFHDAVFATNDDVFLPYSDKQRLEEAMVDCEKAFEYYYKKDSLAFDYFMNCYGDFYQGKKISAFLKSKNLRYRPNPLSASPYALFLAGAFYKTDSEEAVEDYLHRLWDELGRANNLTGLDAVRDKVAGINDFGRTDLSEIKHNVIDIIERMLGNVSEEKFYTPESGTPEPEQQEAREQATPQAFNLGNDEGEALPASQTGEPDTQPPQQPPPLVEAPKPQPVQQPQAPPPKTEVVKTEQQEQQTQQQAQQPAQQAQPAVDTYFAQINKLLTDKAESLIDVAKFMIDNKHSGVINSSSVALKEEAVKKMDAIDILDKLRRGDLTNGRELVFDEIDGTKPFKDFHKSSQAYGKSLKTLRNKIKNELNKVMNPPAPPATAPPATTPQKQTGSGFRQSKAKNKRKKLTETEDDIINYLLSA